jgi:hypothetical protein
MRETMKSALAALAVRITVNGLIWCKNTLSVMRLQRVGIASVLGAVLTRVIVAYGGETNNMLITDLQPLR